MLVKAFDGEPKDSDIELQEEELQPLKENGMYRLNVDRPTQLYNIMCARSMHVDTLTCMYRRYTL